jgi:AraC family transcriptional regulator
MEAELVRIPAGRAVAPGGEKHVVGIHFGAPVNADCSIGGVGMRGVQKQGDIGVIPAGVGGSWEDDAACQILRLSLPTSVVDDVAQQLGKGSAGVELTPDPQLRDARIEAIGWAIKADLEDDTPSDPLYVDLLTNALAVRLIEVATGRRSQLRSFDAARMSKRQLKLITEFIESNLGQTLSLAELAAVAGVSTTHLKTLFRNSTGTPVHRYVIGRRIEYARALLATTSMPASQVALAAGFAHQSHMASTMRRILGHTPSEIERPPNEF